MADEEWKPHEGGMGYTTCLPDPRWDGDRWVENVGHALVGLVAIRMLELCEADDRELMRLAMGAGKVIGEKGDAFMFQKQKRGKWKPSGVLGELATGFAVLALNTPETGVTRLAFHACFWEHPGCPMDLDR
ncbi:hypothetical protein ABZ517_05090 [Streptomyces scabiei]|uniref:hypothetical protein n=1 Tax=Streptomyces scabiei TaxID=1930 RepID=UPI00340362C5